MFKRFRRRREREDAPEVRSLANIYNEIMEQVRDLTEDEYKRLKKAMDSGYNAYRVVRSAEDVEEREAVEVDVIEESLGELMEGER